MSIYHLKKRKEPARGHDLHRRPDLRKSHRGRRGGLLLQENRDFNLTLVPPQFFIRVSRDRFYGFCNSYVTLTTPPGPRLGP